MKLPQITHRPSSSLTLVVVDSRRRALVVAVGALRLTVDAMRLESHGDVTHTHTMRRAPARAREEASRASERASAQDECVIVVLLDRIV